MTQGPYLPPPDPSGYHGSVGGPLTVRPSTNPSAASAADGDAVTAPGATPAPGTTSANGAATPPSTTTAHGAASAPSDAQVRDELRRAYGTKAGEDVDQAVIEPDGLADIPETAPPKLVALMQGANEVARKPYVYGGGHRRNPHEIWSDSAYDCSGSVSYALAAAGYLKGPLVSGALAHWGKPGPGKWVTILANGGHAFMVVAGLRFDTSGRQITGTRWQAAGARSYAGFAVRHPPGL